MKIVIILLTIIGLALSTECPHDLEVKCIQDINQAYAMCDKAAKEKGKDIIADIQCMKYLAQVEKDCWPCICFVAEQLKWHIKGCGGKSN